MYRPSHELVMARELAQMIHQFSKEPCRTLYLVISCSRTVMLQLRYDRSGVDITDFGFSTEGTEPRWELAFTKAKEGFASFRLDKTETATFMDAWWEDVMRPTCTFDHVCEIGLYCGQLGRYGCYGPDDSFVEERLILTTNNTICSTAMSNMSKVAMKHCALHCLDLGMFYRKHTDVSQLPLQEYPLQ